MSGNTLITCAAIIGLGFMAGCAVVGLALRSALGGAASEICAHLTAIRTRTAPPGTAPDRPRR